MSKRKRLSSKDALQTRPRTYLASAMPLRVAAAVGLLILCVAFAYLPAINGGFVLDDDVLLTGNSIIKASDGLYRFWCTAEAHDYWPVSNTSLWIEWRLWKMHPAGYHATNLILHVATALLIWIILRKLSIPGAFLAALIFAVHPVNVESAAWIASRKNLMAMLFFLLSILWYLKFLERVARPTFSWCPLAAKQKQSTDHRPLSTDNSPSFSFFNLHPSSFNIWYWLSLSAFVLAMLGKGSVAFLPIILLAIAWWLRRWITRWDLLRTTPFFIVAALLVPINIWFQTHGNIKVYRSADFIERLLGAGGVVWFYLYKAILPLNLCIIYPQWHIKTDSLAWWLPLIAAAAITIVLWRYRNSWGRHFLFAWFFFCAALTPAAGLSDVGFMQYSLVADRYQHMAIIAAIALAAAGWSLWREHLIGWGGGSTAAPTNFFVRSAANAAAVVLICALMFLSRHQACLYSDAITFYRAVLEKYPNSCQMLNNMGIALAQTGRSQEAVEQYKLALRLKPDYPESYNNLGDAMASAGRLTQAVELYRKAIQFNPDYFAAYNNLGNAFEKLGRLNEAIDHYRQAVRIHPDFAEAHYNLGNALNSIGSTTEAIEHYEKSLELNPDFVAAYNNLGMALVKESRLTDAMDRYQQALRINPDFPEAHNNLGIILDETGRLQEAIKHYRQAVRLKPDYAQAHFNMAIAYAKTDWPDEAVTAAQKALNIARSNRQAELARQIEDWLNSIRANPIGK